ncbi:MAG TPA: hypothetical protein VFU13_08785 [Steroidobacteraceae bacterium]|nr:hypothetical protein [Steroidobacteraceae bacterium]
MRAEPRFKPLPAEAAMLLSEGRFVEAVESVRRTEGVGRSDARRRVDSHLAQEPLLRVQIETQRRGARRRFFFWFVVVDLAITAGVIYWLFYRGS